MTSSVVTTIEDDIKKKMVGSYRPTTVDELKVAAKLVKERKIKKTRYKTKRQEKERNVSIHFSELNNVDGKHIRRLSSYCNEKVIVNKCSPLLPFLSNVKCKKLLLSDMTISAQEWEKVVEHVLQNVETLELEKIDFSDSENIIESITKKGLNFKCKKIACTYSSYRKYKDLFISLAEVLKWEVFDDDYNVIKIFKSYLVF